MVVDGRHLIPEIHHQPQKINSSEGAQYQYLSHLLRLESCLPVTAWRIPHVMSVVRTPLNVEAWSRALEGHEDTKFVRYLLNGLTEGFRIGHHTLQPSSRNMQSAKDNAIVVEHYLQSEVEKGRIVGPLEADQYTSEPLWGHTKK